MKAVILLADSAQRSGAKIHALGIGWAETTTPTPPAAILLFLEVPWDECNTRHKVKIALVDADGRPVRDPRGPKDRVAFVAIEAEFETGRPAGLPAGSGVPAHLTLNIGGGLKLTAGQMYEWRLDIDGEHEETWSAKFMVRDPRARRQR